MDCFYHPSRSAVGLCKACQRGLCPDCAADAGGALACRGRHEDQVRRLERLASLELLQAERMKSSYLRNAIFYFLAGAAFSGYGVYQLEWMGVQGLFLLLIGLFLLYAALANFLESRKYK